MHRAIHPFVKLAPIVVASAALIWLAGTPAHASHLGESLTTDQQLVSVNNQFLGALAAWEKLPPSLKSSNLANLVGLAQTRQQLMIALLQLDPKVAAARALPQSIRARMPSQVAAFVEETVRVQGNGAVHVSDNFAGGTSKSVFKLLATCTSSPARSSRSLRCASATTCCCSTRNRCRRSRKPPAARRRAAACRRRRARCKATRRPCRSS